MIVYHKWERACRETTLSDCNCHRVRRSQAIHNYAVVNFYQVFVHIFYSNQVVALPLSLSLLANTYCRNMSGLIRSLLCVHISMYTCMYDEMLLLLLLMIEYRGSYVGWIYSIFHVYGLYMHKYAFIICLINII